MIPGALPGAYACVLGIDIGGSGTRARLRRVAGVDAQAVAEVAPGAAPRPSLQITEQFGGARIGPGGSNVTRRALEALAWAQTQLEAGESIVAICLGATGLATLVPEPREVVTALTAAAGGGVPVTACIDAVTAHIGALGGQAGAVVAAGTGTVALGSDLRGVWRRVDGWGHLLGDLGGAAWIGMEGLRAAARAHDGRRIGASEELLDRAVGIFGPVETWPSQFYTREDRASQLGSFAREVSAAAAAGDGESIRIASAAGRWLADAADAALGDDLPERVACVGGVTAAGGVLRDSFAAALLEVRPAAEILEPHGGSLDGAVLAATLELAGHPLPDHPPFVYRIAQE